MRLSFVKYRLGAYRLLGPAVFAEMMKVKMKFKHK